MFGDITYRLNVNSISRVYSVSLPATLLYAKIKKTQYNFLKSIFPNICKVFKHSLIYIFNFNQFSIYIFRFPHQNSGHKVVGKIRICITNTSC